MRAKVKWKQANLSFWSVLKASSRSAVLLWFVCGGIWRPVDRAHTGEQACVCSCVWKSVRVCNAGQCSCDGRLVKSEPRGGQTKADLRLMRSSSNTRQKDCVYLCLCLFVWWLNAPSCSSQALTKYLLSFESVISALSLSIVYFPSWYTPSLLFPRDISLVLCFCFARPH